MKKNTRFPLWSIGLVLALTGLHSPASAESSLELDGADLPTISPDTFSNSPNDPPDFEALYESMRGWRDCSGSDCRTRLKSRGRWKSPHPETIAAMRALRFNIISVSNEYGIDARVLIGIALGEASINGTNTGNGLQRAAERLLGPEGARDLAASVGRDISQGLAAVNVLGACEALPWRQAIEPSYAPGITCRRERSGVAEFSNGFKPRVMDTTARGRRGGGANADESIRFAAALIRMTQDHYKALGNPACEISGNMGALATVYNMGWVHVRASNSQCRNGETPGWNYMGLWIERNESVNGTIAQILEGTNYTPRIASTPARTVPAFDPPPSRRTSYNLEINSRAPSGNTPGSVNEGITKSLSDGLPSSAPAITAPVLPAS